MHVKKVSVIIVSYNVRYFLELCLDAALRALQDIDSEVIVVDNNSTDESLALVRARFPAIKLIANDFNAGFSKANNQGVAIAQGSYIHFLNPDTVVPEDFYKKIIGFMEAHPEAGAIGPRIVDGRGLYSPDSKKSFPSFWPSLYKVTGLSAIFKKSPVFNKYYAAQVAENETAPVDILSGCCLLVRKEAMDNSGGSFDESYFMYCEDFDLCHRLRLAGYKNYYFPETTIIHYKGESTRKLTMRYVRIFNDALSLFVKKYYPRRLGNTYIFMLKIVMGLRTVINWGKYLFSLFKMFLVDTLLLSLVMVLMKRFWLVNITPEVMLDTRIFITTAPLFILTWLLSLFLNGAYDKPFSLFRAGRGMILGTILVLAGYGLLPVDYRYSRGIILFTGMTGTAVLLLFRWLLALSGFIKLVPRGRADYKAAISGNYEEYKETRAILRKIRYNREVVGCIVSDNHEEGKIGDIKDINDVQRTYRINEIIFNSGSIPYKDIIGYMELCAPRSFYKIHVPGSDFIVGSNSVQQNSDEYLAIKKYNIASTASLRNRRILDISASVFLLFIFPFISFRVKNAGGLLRNIFRVLGGSRTWIGYDKRDGGLEHLPDMKPAILPPFVKTEHYRPEQKSYELLAERYATDYSALDDLRILLSNLRFAGEKS